MRRTLLAALVAAVMVCMPALCLAGMRAQNFQERAYDPETVTTVKGKVVKVEEINRKGGRSGGIHVILDTADGNVNAHLGPKWYIDNLDLGLKPGDEVEVTGSKLYVVEELTIIVREIKRGDESVVLRDESGVPYWSGWRKGGAGGMGGRGPGRGGM